MKRKTVCWGTVALGAALVLAHGGGRSRAVAAPNAGRTPVLVELFTSEGCSSCPPADAVLSDLTRTQPVPGAEVIALGEHVDYWNNGAWADLFSDHAFSARQSDYAGHFHNSSVYTPQMVVDGRAEFVGSDRDRAVREIARAARAPKADVQITVDAASGGTAPLRVRVDHLPPGTGTDPARVFLAVTEDGLRSDVRGGENGGRTLRHSAVVRRLSLLGVAHPGTAFVAQPTVSVAPGWNRATLQAVVFVQTREGHRVVGAGVTPLSGSRVGLGAGSR